MFHQVNSCHSGRKKGTSYSHYFQNLREHNKSEVNDNTIGLYMYQTSDGT